MVDIKKLSLAKKKRQMYHSLFLKKNSRMGAYTKEKLTITLKLWA